jgi:hypothetical protein
MRECHQSTVRDTVPPPIRSLPQPGGKSRQLTPSQETVNLGFLGRVENRRFYGIANRIRTPVAPRWGITHTGLWSAAGWPFLAPTSTRSYRRVRLAAERVCETRRVLRNLVHFMYPTSRNGITTGRGVGCTPSRYRRIKGVGWFGKEEEGEGKVGAAPQKEGTNGRASHAGHAPGGR